MSTMRAARLIEPGKPLEIHDVPVPVPAPDELLVEVRACGICGTDLHLAVVGDMPVERTPITLGHEAAGVVVATGDEVSDLKHAVAVMNLCKLANITNCTIATDKLNAPADN
ncbi:MAG: alcohol dehydrogenase catalytic domain-containing protein [Candidatus Hydrogenedentes bacterium]|nr:alcohol dehydrogenase catalytic domain-containing protein [Candidatus Hydrogenedentota bacterium]